MSPLHNIKSKKKCNGVVLLEHNDNLPLKSFPDNTWNISMSWIAQTQCNLSGLHNKAFCWTRSYGKDLSSFSLVQRLNVNEKIRSLYNYTQPCSKVIVGQSLASSLCSFTLHGRTRPTVSLRASLVLCLCWELIGWWVQLEFGWGPCWDQSQLAGEAQTWTTPFWPLPAQPQGWRVHGCFGPPKFSFVSGKCQINDVPEHLLRCLYLWKAELDGGQHTSGLLAGSSAAVTHWPI